MSCHMGLTEWLWHGHSICLRRHCGGSIPEWERKQGWPKRERERVAGAREGVVLGFSCSGAFKRKCLSCPFMTIFGKREAD